MHSLRGPAAWRGQLNMYERRMNNRVIFWSWLEVDSRFGRDIAPIRKRHSSYSDLDKMEVIHGLAEIKVNVGSRKEPRLLKAPIFSLK